MKTTYLYFFLLIINFSFSQTILTAGDIAVIGFKTNTSTDGGNDAVKLVTLVDLECNTSFIVTDNNWNSSTPGWACNDDEFAIEIVCNNIIPSGSVFYIDAETSGNSVTCSGGAITKSDLGSPWGINYGLSSQGDNVYILQGTRSAPTFIFAFKHSAFSNTSCSNKDQAGLPSGLTLGNNAVAMSSTKDQWHFNCVTNNGNRVSIKSAICNASNWVSTAGQNWNNTSGIFTVTDGNIQYGTLAVSGAGCGYLSGCNLSYSGGTNGASVSGDCVSGYLNMSKNIIVPTNCTYSITAEMKNRGNGCGSSGADGNCQNCDVVKVDILGGSKIFQQGASNSSLIDSYSTTGPATIVVSGKANRADEIITYSIKVTPCTCLASLLPIELVLFNATLQENVVGLNWTTASEINNDYFSIERSGDANYWNVISLIRSLGNSQTTKSYSVFDYNPLSDISYYRLKQTDISGRFTYSKIISISNHIEEQKIVRRLNLYGQDVDENTTGLIILVYENGTVKKIYK